MINIIVTGGAGNIGSALVKNLLNKNKYKVIIIDNFVTGKEYKLPSKKNKNWKLLKININKVSNISKLIKFKKIDYIFHFAALVGVKRTLNNPLNVLEDIEGMKNILTLSKYFKVKRLFYSSSSEVYGESISFPQNENNTPLNSRLPYAAVKNICEAFIKTYNKEYDLNYTIFRFFNTYGPNQSEEFVITKFINKAINNETIEIYGDGKQSRTFCYIDDNIYACIKCLEDDKYINNTINIGSEFEINMKNLAKKIKKLCNSKSLISYIDPLVEGDMFRRVPDLTKMKKLISQKKFTNLDHGILKTLKEIKKKNKC